MKQPGVWRRYSNEEGGNMVDPTIAQLYSLRIVLSAIAAAILTVSTVRALQASSKLEKSQLRTTFYLMSGLTTFFALWMFGLSYTLAMALADRDRALFALLINIFSFIGLLFFLGIVFHITRYVRGDVAGMHANELDEDAFAEQLWGSVVED